MKRNAVIRATLVVLFVLFLNFSNAVGQEKHYRYKYKGTRYLMENNEYGEMKYESYNSRFSSYIVLSTSADRKKVWLDSDKKEMGFFGGEYNSNNGYKYTDLGSSFFSEEVEWTNMLISVNYETVCFFYYVPAPNGKLYTRQDTYEYVGTTSAPHNVEREKHERWLEEQKKRDAEYEANREKREAEEAKRQAEKELYAIRVGEPLPAINYLVDRQGKKVDNSFFKRGSKTLVITYYHCPPALALMKYIKDKGIDSNVITISVFPKSEQKLITGAVNLFREKAKDHHYEWCFGQKVPYCVLLDGNGVVISDKLGFFVGDTAEIDSMVSAIRNEQMQAFNLSNMPKNEIWYTTTDGNKITHNFDGCVSHSYTNGKGVIKFKNNLTSIEYCGFYKCSSLKSIRIPDSVTSIGKEAFADCTSLTRVVIPDGVTAIGGAAFRRCTSLTSITIPDRVTSIGDSAFSDCTSLTSVTIPDGVTSIGRGAFYDCSSLKSVTIPDSVTSIGSSAFWGCNSLTSIIIGNSVKEIKWEAFEHCTSLKSVTVGNSVTEIEGFAFNNCTSLKSLTIPDSVTSIDYSAFQYCNNLTDMYINITNLSTYMANRHAYPRANNTHLLVNGREITELVIPNGITSIGNYAFRNCSSLTSLTIPDSVTLIGYAAFDGCTSLTSVTIPNSVTTIGEFAFYRCNGLTSLTIPDSVTSIGHATFNKCTSLTSVTIGNSVTSIGSFAFHGCTRLTSITIPNSVTSIGSSAFWGCNSLTSITIPNRVTSIGSYAFAGCSSMTSITIFDSVTSIGNNAFATSGIRELVLPQGLTSVPVEMCYNCGSLESVTIPSRVTSIGANAFRDCSSLKSITIPNSVTSIGELAFKGCSGKLAIDNKMVEIDHTPETKPSKNGWLKSTAFREIEFGNNVKKIGAYTFHHYPAIKKVAISKSVEVIGEGALSGTSIDEIVIPEGVVSIEKDAFNSCTKLKSVIFESPTPPQLGAGVFQSCDPECVIYVPAANIKAYKKSWKDILGKYPKLKKYKK